MSLTLGIDTSSLSLSVGLYKNNAPCLSQTRFEKHSHSKYLASTVKELLEKADAGIEDITRCGIVTGPGSFTGLRIGIAFVKGAFINYSPRIYPVSSLRVIAEALSGARGRIGVALDARQDNVFFACYKKDVQGCNVIAEPCRISREEFLSRSESCDLVAYDTMGFARSTVFNNLPSPASLNISAADFSRGISAAQIADTSQDPPCSALEVEPEYMQDSYAQQKRAR
ncbi:MAG: tRNA (adenosine(37)-N6)-threonylcarbamoyltransferase complex dimerization subunit type 1 TsaB [Fibrobacterota bacterium]